MTLKYLDYVTKRFLSSQKREYREVCIKVPWGQISGKWWEPYDTRPILTLHGWMDNCGSFDRLIPLLNQNIGFLALDFPGHGYSSWIPKGMFYNHSINILTIRAIKDYFKWQKISLLGHSLGAMISYSFSMLYNSEVDLLMCLDSSKPIMIQDKGQFLAEIYLNFFKYDKQALNSNEFCYSLDEIVDKVSGSVLPKYAKYIIERNIAPSKIHKGKFYFRRDPRLKTNDIPLFCQDELLHLAKNMTFPIFITKAKDGFNYEPEEYLYAVLDVLKKTNMDCEFHHVEGTHHMHLNKPEDVAGLINNFIKKHNVKDRSIGDTTQDIIVDKRNNIFS